MNPCKGCVPPERTPTCHSTCPKYAKFSANVEKKRHERNQDVMVDVYLAAKSKYIRRWYT